MEPLHGLLAFVKTADLGSFAAAGRALEVSASAVGKAVARLEREVGVRLFQRSTRRMQLTEEGRRFHERCRRALDELDAARADLAHARARPRGRLRIGAPVVGGWFLLPLIPEFVARHPEVELDIRFTDRRLDLIEEGIDLAIRSGEPPDSRLVARPLQAFRLLLCASPAYLARHGRPADVRELERHAAVRFRHPDTGKLLDWPMLAPADGHPRTVLACDNAEAVLGAALRGLGIACLPDFVAGEALASGRLERVLDALADAPGAGGRFNALWPQARTVPPKVRAFVDHLAERLVASDKR